MIPLILTVLLLSLWTVLIITAGGRKGEPRR